MVMKPYSQQFQATSYLYDNYTKTTTASSRVVSSRSLGGIVSYHGDYKHPNTHAYIKSAQRGYVGRMTSYVSGKLSQQRWGSHPIVYSPAALVPPVETSVLSTALNRAYDQLRGEMDLSVDLVQWRQVVQMANLHRRLVRTVTEDMKRLIPTFDSIDRLKRDLRDRTQGRRRRKRLTRELNNSLNYLAQKRLEYVYGWVPTLNTIADLSELASNPKAPGWIKAEGSAKSLTRQLVTSYAVDSRVPVKHYIFASNRAKVVMYFTPQQEVLDTLGKISSLNPLAVLYEATPFSFVVDQLWNVGSWLRSMETAFMHRNDFAGGYQTTTQRVSIGSRMTGISTSSPGTFVDWDISGDALFTRFNRTTLGSVAYPAHPARKFTFTQEQTFTAIALLKAVVFRGDGYLAGRR